MSTNVTVFLGTLLVMAAAVPLFRLVSRVLDRLAQGRTRRAAPAPPEFDLPPALVCLLVHGGHQAPHGAAATLFDLAARGDLVLEQHGADPTGTTVRPGSAAAGAPRPKYEQYVLNRVNSLIDAAGAGRATLADLARWRRDELPRPWPH